MAKGSTRVCGIAGIVGLAGELAAPRLDCALERIRHRGPDGAGTWLEDGFALGMRRLAIIDLAGGDQPIFNEDRSIGVVCNGELYNYVELLELLSNRGHRFQSRSDVNVLPHLYEEQGVDGIAQVRGMFAAALWDARSQRLVLWRDRVGKKPLFYAKSSNGVAFASELPALLALLDSPPELDFRALAWYLRLGFVPHPLTIYRDVRCLPPGCSLSWTLASGTQVARYWNPALAPALVPPIVVRREEVLERVDTALREAVRIRLRSDVPLGVFLSGGIDSGLVSAYASALGASDLLAFVVEVPDPALNEAHLAELSARHLGLQVERLPIDIAPVDEVEAAALRYGQPFADASAIPSYRVAQAAAQHRKVVLNGDGGDEVFTGYRRYKLGQLAARLSGEPSGLWRGVGRMGASLGAAVGRRNALGFAARALRGIGLSEADRYLAWTVDLLTPEMSHEWFPSLPAVEWGGGDAPEQPQCRDTATMMASDFGLILPDDLLVKMDIATMASSLEGRSPFLDVPMIEDVWRLPMSLRTGGRATKPLLRALAARYLPPEISVAPKRGFEVPVVRWLRNDLQPLLQDTLLAPDSRVGAMMTDRHHLRAFAEEQTTFAGNWGSTLWAFLMLELFLRAPTPAPAR